MFNIFTMFKLFNRPKIRCQNVRKRNENAVYCLKFPEANMADDKPHWGIAPYFIVDNVVDTASYYRDKLGFKYDRFWGEPPCFCMVRRSGIIVMLSQLDQTGVMRPNSVAVPDNGGCWDAYIWVENVDALYQEFRSKGVTIARDICDQLYGCRDFDIEDINGYRLCFGQDLER